MLNLAISYGSRDEILGATRTLASRCLAGELTPDDIDRGQFRVDPVHGGVAGPGPAHPDLRRDEGVKLPAVADRVLGDPRDSRFCGPISRERPVRGRCSSTSGARGASAA